MSQAATYIPGPAAGTHWHGAGLGFWVLVAALVMVGAGGMLATALLDGSGEVGGPPRLAPAPSALPAAAATGSTSVPDARAVFAGREVEIEEPAPTF